MSAIFKPVRVHCGFTLLELLIAISVFAVMSVMAYGGLSQIIRNNDSAEKSLARMQEVQQAMYTLTRDFNQIIERDIRDEFGNPQSYLSAGSNLDMLVEFSRSGRRNPAKLLRSHLQRVAYQLKDNTLYRLTWAQLDRVQGMEPNSNELLTDVETIEIRFLDATAEWRDAWPPLSFTATPGTTAPLPVAIEINITLKDWGSLKRLYKVRR